MTDLNRFGFCRLCARLHLFLFLVLFVLEFSKIRDLADRGSCIWGYLDKIETGLICESLSLGEGNYS